LRDLGWTLKDLVSAFVEWYLTCGVPIDRSNFFFVFLDTVSLYIKKATVGKVAIAPQLTKGLVVTKGKREVARW